MSIPQQTIDVLIEQPSLFKQLKPSDWLWAGFVIAAALFVFAKYGSRA